MGSSPVYIQLFKVIHGITVVATLFVTVACGPRDQLDVSGLSDIQLVGEGNQNWMLYQENQHVILKRCRSLQRVSNRNCNSDSTPQSLPLTSYIVGLAKAFNIDSHIVEYPDLSTYDAQLTIVREDLASGQLSGNPLELAKKRYALLKETRPLFADVILPILQSLTSGQDIRLHSAYHSYTEQLVAPFQMLQFPRLAPYTIDPVTGLAWHKANNVCYRTSQASKERQQCLQISVKSTLVDNHYPTDVIAGSGFRMYEVKHLNGSPVVGTRDFDIYEDSYQMREVGSTAVSSASSCEEIFGTNWTAATEKQIKHVVDRHPFYSGVLSSDGAYIADQARLETYQERRSAIESALASIDLKINLIESQKAPVTATSGPRLLRRLKVQRAVLTVERHNLDYDDERNPLYLAQFLKVDATRRTVSYQLPVACVADADDII